MANYKSPQDMPYNVCPNSTYFWKVFVEQTLAGNAYASISAYHNYTQAKQKVFEGKQNQFSEDLSF